MCGGACYAIEEGDGEGGQEDNIWQEVHGEV